MKKRLNRSADNLGALLLDVRQVAALCNLGISTIWKMSKANNGFPQPQYFGPRIARWKAEDVRRWVHNLGS